MRWEREAAGLYRAEIETTKGAIELTCSNLLTGGKWRWRVRWPGGASASGLVDKLGVCKEMCENAACQYEPEETADGTVFRRISTDIVDQ